MKPFYPKAKEASSWTIIHLWIWFGGIYALQCPSGLSSTSLSLPTHYMQVLDNTWVPCNVQMVNFHLSRQFCHSYIKFRSGLLSNWKPSTEAGAHTHFEAHLKTASCCRVGFLSLIYFSPILSSVKSIKCLRRRSVHWITLMSHSPLLSDVLASKYRLLP